MPASRFLALAGLLAGIAGTAFADRFPEPVAFPRVPELQDPLVRLDGSRVTSARDWNRHRRPELKAMFAHYMYGPLPDVTLRPSMRVTAEHADFLGGKATLRLVTLTWPGEGAPAIDLMLVVPNQRTGRVPVFLAMNFCGNHALTADPRVPLTRGWLYNSCKGCRDNRATEDSRGGQAGDWPLEEIIDRGYALASFCSTDVDSDRGDVSDGVYAWLARRDGRPELARPANRGTISAWAWGYHRCVDYLETDRAIDAKRIAVVGHSRNGKTALLAAALDERIALAIPHQAGCGGTAPSRGRVGESVKQINDRFPHWFNGVFKQFNEETGRLPFDQHCLVALMAPRPVLLSNAQEDQWANPTGQFEVLRAAEPVYQLLKAGGVGADSMPPEGQLLKGRLGYYIRPGKHSMTAGDWRVFLEFADAHFHPAR